VFSIKKGQGVLDRDPIRVGSDHVTRLVKKPQHKPLRKKFNPHQQESLGEKVNLA